MSHAGYNTHIDCTCTDCKLRYPKYFAWYGWENLRKLDTKKEVSGKVYYRDVQEELCKRYDVILTDWQPPSVRRKIKWQLRWQKVKHILYRIKVFLDNQHEKNQSRRNRKKTTSKPLSDFGMSEREYQKITGKTTDQDLSFITSRGKKPDLSAITGKGKKDYSGLIGKRRSANFDLGKRDYSGLIGSRKKIRL